MTCLTLATALVLSSSAIVSMPAPVTPSADRRHTRIIAGTEIIGDTDPRVWRSVLDVLPIRPRRIVVLDAGTLSAAVRQKVRGFEAFVVAGNPTVFVLRQSMTLRQAETGDAFDRAVLASVIHHELSHVRGLDELGAIHAEQDLWRRLIAGRLVDFALGSTYLRRLDDEGRKPRQPQALARR